MAKIRRSKLSRGEVDTVDEVQGVFNDVYRILWEQQNEIEQLRTVPSKPGAPAAAEEPKLSKKESKK